jgi:RND superfamily putative drug exporter
MRALATWCVRHRWLVVAIWIGVLVLTTLVSRAVGTAYTNSFTLPHTESTDAITLLKSVAPKTAGDTEQVVIGTSDGRHITDPDVMARVQTMLDKVERLPHVSSVRSPFGPGGADQVSKDGTVAFATITFNQLAQSLPTSLAQDLVDTARSAGGHGIEVAVTGLLAEQANGNSIGGTGLGILLAAVVLLVVFGSPYAMLLPLVSALGSLGTAIGLIGLVSHALKMPVFSSELVLLIGLGVGIDYALFIVTRHRQGLLAGMNTEAAAVNAVDTSGRAVLFAGIIVCIALLSMLAVGVEFLYGLAIAASIGVALTMVAAITLLPALLGFIGPKVMSRRQRRSLAESGPRIVGAGTRGFWPQWADMVRRRPVLPAIAGLLVIVLLALPFFSMRLGSSDQGNDPAGTTTRQGYDLLVRGFGPGFTGPLQLVVSVPKDHQTEVLDRLGHDVAGQPDVARVAPPIVLPGHDDRNVALIVAYPRSAPQDRATSDLLSRLRQVTIPAAVAGTGAVVYVGGNTAIFVDFARVLSAKLPLFIALVVVLAFLLLAVVFRSFVIPLTAAAMNLLSIAAGFGILVAVFQWGWLGPVFGVNRSGPIETFLPVMMFAILFGLSMDYQVFLVSRIHEEWLRSGDNRLAVRNGLAATGKTITAAALIMILVFGSFILGGQRIIKEAGLGLAGGVLVDAVVIRMTIVPSLMLLFGRANWWFPRWLDRVLPRLAVDPASVAPASGRGAEPEPEKLGVG